MSTKQKQNIMSVKAITPAVSIAEGPHWLPQQQTLYYVNILGGEVCKYHESSGKTEKAKIEGGPVSLIVPVENHPDCHVISVGRELVAIEWKSDQPTIVKKLSQVDSNFPDNRFNDGKCDSYGRLWAGTMGAETAPAVLPPDMGSIYCADNKGKCQKRFSPVTLSNGLVWSADSSKFFYIDSCSYSVDVFDFDIRASELKNRRKLYDFKAKGDASIPDGLTIDTNGNLWVACFYGHKVMCINPETQKRLMEVKFPCSNITSCNFGGPNLDILYVTSARTGLRDEELWQQPDAGCVFKVEGLGVKGTPSIPYKLDL